MNVSFWAGIFAAALAINPGGFLDHSSIFMSSFIPLKSLLIYLASISKVLMFTVLKCFEIGIWKHWSC